MTKEVITVKPSISIYEALNLLTKKEISGLPVVDDDNHIVGMLTEKDVLRLMIDEKIRVNATVDEYMSRKVYSFNEDESPITVCKFFIKSHIRRVPITRNKKLVGIVARRDIIQLIMEARMNIADFRFS